MTVVPIEAVAHLLSAPTVIRLPNPLAHRPMMTNQGEGTRTHDLLLPRQALYQAELHPVHSSVAKRATPCMLDYLNSGNSVST